MAAEMLHGGPNVCGSVTSGGTESILLAVKTYRDRAAALWGFSAAEMEMVLPLSAHPAFEKAAHFFGIRAVHVPLTDEMTVDVTAMRQAVTRRTILLVVSAPQYPHGVVDPVSAAAELARECRLPLHVDSCIGGFMLPWVQRLGFPVPPFDFAVEGVTSISADVHKYGFGPKGASVLLFSDAKYRQYQYFVYGKWPGGLFASPGLTGTRGGGPIAAAWASMVALGQDGFLDLAKQLMDTSVWLQEQINNVEGLHIIGKPHMTIISFSSSQVNVLAVADAMETRGWKMERQQNPASVHMTLMPPHTQPEVREALVADLKWAVEWVRQHPESATKGSAGMYGMVAVVPAPHLVDRFLNLFLNKVYS